jgi:hypothetical protein
MGKKQDPEAGKLGSGVTTLDTPTLATTSGEMEV